MLEADLDRHATMLEGLDLDAMAMLDDGDGPAQSATVEMLRRKVKKTLALDLESPELMDALEVVSEFWQGNTPENRQNLRSDLERRNVERAEAFVEHFAPLRDALLDSERNAEALETEVATTLAELRESDAEARRVVAAHDALCAKRDDLARRRDEVVDFLATYRLTDGERDALARGDVDAEADEFFAALARAATARAAVVAAAADPAACRARGATIVPEGKLAEDLLQDLDGATADGSVRRSRNVSLKPPISLGEWHWSG